MKYITGYTNCYIQDHPFYHLCSMPIEAAVEWVKNKCPNVMMGANIKGKDLTVDNALKNGWLNKRFVVVGDDHGHSFALVNWDGRFSVYKKRFEDD